MILRPLESRDAEDLRRIRRTREVERWWFPVDDGFPLHDEPDVTRLTIEVDGAVAGMIQFSEELEPLHRHASIDLFVSERGHHRTSASCAHTSATPTGAAGTTGCSWSSLCPDAR